MCDCFHLAFPNWHAASSGTGGGRRLRGPESTTEDDSICDEPSGFTEGERPRPQGSSPVEEYPESEKFDSDGECQAEHDPHQKSGSGTKTKKPGLGSMFEKRSTPKMSKLKEAHSPESEVIVKTAKDGCAEGLVYSGGGKDGLYIKEVVPESPASRSLKLKEGDQILSATVYFDNVPYEDAIQILEHAQAYKMKLCLKRKPDITQTDEAIESNVIPEGEELKTPEMRKTKRRGDARISWPKFPSLGRGRKTRFTRSHSSSEADEQRKLELSPTTSDTESPIKSQDALRGKKKHKMKLSVMTKRGRISSSEEQDTDVATSAQISSDVQQTQEIDMLSPEYLEETPKVFVTEQSKVITDPKLEPNNEMQKEAPSPQHKVELISIDSTLKTADLTVALADSEIKSPDGKKKKKERSEMKIKILGKDKSHKKTKSPKRLKTLGASLEVADGPDSQKADVVTSQETPAKLLADQTSTDISPQKGEHDLADVTVTEKYPHKDKPQKSKSVKKFKLPKFGSSETPIEEIKTSSVEQFANETEKLPNEVTDDPYEKLSKRAQLPKREEIEIPGMEDLSKARVQKIKKAKSENSENQPETEQLLIDVDRVKEAVSKLPGYKLPKVDTSGMPIPEEITVIDANAQRISVKTPTKVVESRTKQETHLMRFGSTGLPENSKPSFKQPKLRSVDLTTEELLFESKEQRTKPGQIHRESKTTAFNRDIILTEHLCAHDFDQKDRGIQGQKTIFLQDERNNQQGEESEQGSELVSDVKIIEIEGIEFIDSIDSTPPKMDDSIQFTGYDSSLGTQLNATVSITGVRPEKEVVAIPSEIKVEKFQEVIKTDVPIEQVQSRGGIQMPKPESPKIDSSFSEVHMTLGHGRVSIPEQQTDKEKPEMKITPIQRGKKIDKEAEDPSIKFKIPTFHLPKLEVPTFSAKMSEDGKHVKVDVKNGKENVFQTETENNTYDDPEMAVVLERADITKANEQVREKMPIKHPKTEEEQNRGTEEIKESALRFKIPKFKLPKFGVEPKTNSPEEEVSTVDIERPRIDIETASNVNKMVDIADEKKEKHFKLPGLGFKVPDVDLISEGEVNLDVRPIDDKNNFESKDGKFKLKELGVKLPGVQGTEFDLSSSKRDVDIQQNKNVYEVKLPDAPVKLPETKIKVELPDVELKRPSAEVEMKAPEISLQTSDVEESPSRFKLPTFRTPKFSLPSTQVSELDKNIEINEDVKIEGGKVEVKLPEFEVKGPSITTSLSEGEDKSKKQGWTMPSFSFSKASAKVPEAEINLEAPKVDITLPEAKTDVNIDIKQDRSISTEDGTAPDFDLKLKKPRFSLPKISFSKQSIKAPDVDVDLPNVDVSLPEVNLEIKQPDFELNQQEGEIQVDSQGKKFKLPKFDFKVPDVHLSKPNISMNLPETKVEVSTKDTDESQPGFHMPTLKIPKFALATHGLEADIPDMDTDIKVAGPDITVPDTGLTANIEAPAVDLSVSSLDMKTKEEESEKGGKKFKLPSLGFKGHKVDLSMPNVSMNLPETKVEVSTKDTDESQSGFHFPTLKIPKFALAAQSLEADIPDMDTDIKVAGPDITVPDTGLTVNIEAPAVDLSVSSLDMKTKGEESEKGGKKFKLPSFGFKVPKVDLSKPNVDTNLPDTKIKIEIPDAELKTTPFEKKSPETKDSTKDTESQSGFHFPTLKIPKFALAAQSLEADIPDMDTDIKVAGPDITVPDTGLTVNIEAPAVDLSVSSLDMKTKGEESDKGGKKFKLPSLGFKGPEVHLSKTDVDAKLPEAKVEIELPDVDQQTMSTEIKSPEIKVSTKDKDGSPSRFKLPSFKMPKFGARTKSLEGEIPEMDTEIKVEGPEITVPEEVLQVNIEAPTFDTTDLSLDVKTKETDHERGGRKFKLPSLGFKGPDLDVSKTDVDVKLPEAKVKVELPDAELKQPLVEVDIKAPELSLQTTDIEESSSKFKLPTFRLPKFGSTSPHVSGEIPDVDKLIKFEGEDVKMEGGKVEVKLPEFEVKGPSIATSLSEGEDKSKKQGWTMPSFSFSKTSAKVPEAEINLEAPKVDIILPEAKTDVNIDIKQDPSISTEDGTAPDFDLKLKKPRFSLPKISFSKQSTKAAENDLNVEIKQPDLELNQPEGEIQVDGQERKFKLPKFGFKGPDVHLSKPNISMNLPETKVEVSTKDTDESQPGFHMPTLKIPKFALATQSLEADIPDMDTDIKVAGPDITVPDTGLTVNIEAPAVDLSVSSLDMKTKEEESEKGGKKFKLPSLGFKGPEVHLSKTDVDAKLPEAKVEVELPDVELKKMSTEIKSPEIKVSTKDKDGSPSRFKLPTFKMPKFGARTKSLEGEIPEMDTEIKIEGPEITVPEEVLEVNIVGPTFDTTDLSLDVKTKETDHERGGRKFKLPSLGFKGPDLDVSKTDVDVKLPEAKVEVALPDVELKKMSTEIKSPEIKVSTKDKDGSPSRFKLPSFKIPTFGARTKSLEGEIPEMDTEIKVEGPDITVPEEVLEVNIEGPAFDTTDLSFNVKTKDTGHERGGKKFKLPSLGFKGPDLELSKTDIDVKLPEAKVEVELPDVELKKMSTEIKSPDIKISTKDKDGSPSRFKLPTFKMPKFGARTKSLEGEIPEMDTEIKIEGPDITVPDEVLQVNIEAPTFDTTDLSLDVKTKEADHERGGGKFKLPSLGFKGPDVKFSKTFDDAKLTEAKVEVELPDVELEKPSTKLKSPEIKVSTKDKDGSPSRFKLPTFKIPKFGVRTKSLEGEIPEMDTEIKIEGPDITVPDEVLQVNIEAPTFDTNVRSADAKTKETDHEKGGIKFKLPSLGFKGPDVDVSKTDIDVKLPEAKVEVEIPDVELKQPSAELDIQAPEISLQTSDVQDSPSRFKLPTFRLPKFGSTSPQVSGEIPDVDKQMEIEEQDVKIEGGKVEVKLPEFEVKGPSIATSLSEGEDKSKKQGWTMPSFSFSKASAKVPEAEINLEAPKVDITLPEAKTDVNIDIKQDPSISTEDGTAPDFDLKLKKPRFSLPKISFSKQSTKAPEVDVDLPKVDVSFPEVNLEVKQPDLKLNQQEGEIQVESQGKKFKLPKFDFKVPDVHLSKPNVDMNLPETKVEIDVPDVELKTTSIEIKSPETKVSTKDTEGSQSGFHFPTLKIPKFALAAQSLEADIPDMDTDIKVAGPDITVPDTGLKVNMEGPAVDLSVSSLDMKTKGEESEKGGKKFKLPSLGFKGPEVHLSKTDADAKLPEAKVEVELPDVELKKMSTEIKSPEIKVSTKDKDGSPSRFKLPTFKMPKFGARTKSLEGEIPEMDTEIKIEGPEITVPEEVLEVNIVGPTFDTTDLSLDVKTKETDHERGGRKFKLPSLGFKGPDVDVSKTDVDVKLPEAKVEVELPDVELKKMSTEIKSPEIKVSTKDKDGSPSRFKLPTFKMPKFGARTKSLEGEIPEMDTEMKVEGLEIIVPDEVLQVNIEVPTFDTTDLSLDVKTKETDHERGGRKFKLPSLGFKGPDVDVSKTDIDVKLPDAKVEVQLPDVELKQPLAEVEIKGPELSLQTIDIEESSSKFKLPTFRLPKFGSTSPQVSGKIPDLDKNIEIKGDDVKMEGGKVEVKLPEFEVKGPSITTSLSEGEDKSKKQGWTMPSFSFSKASAKVPEAEINLEAPKVDITLPEAKTDVNIDIKQDPSISTEDGTAPDFDLKLKKPRFSLPKISFSKQSSKAPEVDVDLPKVDVSFPDVNLEDKQPDFELNQQEGEIRVEGQGKKFKMPKFDFKVPDVHLSKPNVVMNLPETKVEIDVPDVELKTTSIEIKSPETKVSTKDTEGSQSEFHFPTLKIPKFALAAQSLEADIPDMDTDIKVAGPDITVPDTGLTVNMEGPAVDLSVSSLDMKTKGEESEKGGKKFKLPSLGFKGPEVHLSKTDVDAKLPEAKVEIDLPDVDQQTMSTEIKSPEIKVSTKDKDGSPSRFKLPSFKMPKFGARTKSLEGEIPEIDTEIKVEGPEITVPEEVLQVNIEAPTFDTTDLSLDVKTKETDHEKGGIKFKLPSLGFKGPDVDVSKTDIDVKLPEAKVEVQLPDVELKQPSAEVEIKAPEISLETSDVQDSPSKFKLPTFRLPKFGSTSPHVSGEIPDVDKQIKFEGEDAKMEGGKVEVKLPEFEVKGPSITTSLSEGEDKSKKQGWTMPSFSFSKASAKVPEAEINLEAPKVDITLPEAKTDVNIDIKQDPSISTEDGTAPDFDLKLKKPRFSLPKISFSKQSTKAAENDLNVEIKQPDLELNQPEGEIQVDGQGRKFKLPKFGFKGPDVHLSKPNISMNLPETKVEVSTKDTDESQPGFHMPTLKIPKFALATQSLEADIPDMDTDIKVAGPDITVPDTGLTVNIEAPAVDLSVSSLDMKTKGEESEKGGKKFKLPSLGFKGPEVHLSKTDVDAKLPEAKVEVELPDVELKKMSTEIKSPEIKVSTKDKDGSPSKFKLPTFKMPKFGAQTKSLEGEIPEMDTEIKVEGPEITVPDEVLQVNIEAPTFDTTDLSLDVKTTEADHERGDRKFRFPSLGFKGPDVKFSKTDVDLPEVKVEDQLPDVELKQPLVEVDIKAPELSLQTTDIEESSSKFKLPTFRLPKFGSTSPQVSGEIPDVDKLSEIKGEDVKIEGAKVEVKLPEFEGEDKSKKQGWTMPSFSFSKASAEAPEAEINFEAPKVDITLPEAKTDVNIDIKQDPSISTEDGTAPDFDLKLKKPRFSLPKISFSKHSTKAPEVDLPKVDVSHQEVNMETPHLDFESNQPEIKKLKLPKFGFKGPDLHVSKIDVDVKLPSAQDELDLFDADQKGSSAEIKNSEISLTTNDIDVSPSKFKLPTFKIPKFGAATQGPEAEVADLETDTKLHGARVTVPEVGLAVNMKGPTFDTTLPSTDKSRSKFKLPSLEIKGINVDDKKSLGDIAQVQIPQVEMSQQCSEVHIKGLEVTISPSDINVSQPEILIPEATASTKSPKGGEASVTELDRLTDDTTTTGKRPSWTFPKFSFSKSSDTSPNAAVNIETTKLDVKDVEVKGSPINVPKSEFKEGSSNTDYSETTSDGMEAKSKNTKGSALKFKMPTLKMPQFSSGDNDVQAETTCMNTAKMTPTIREPSMESKTGDIQEKLSDMEMHKDGIDSVSPGSPSKFKMPLFKMPKLGFSKVKSEDESVPAHTADKQDPSEVQSELKKESKSPKLSSFGEMFETIDVEFNVPKVEKVEDDKQADGKVESTKSPENTRWFKFPRLSLSSPTEAVKTTEISPKEVSPAGETGDDETSPISSVQSSDAFADVSSTVTSEPVGASLSSPTRVTVKYTDSAPDDTGYEEMMSSVISTARTELISGVPDLPEKITILSSGCSSSSEDTLRLKSSRIHVISSNIQATPEAERAKLLTAVQIQPAEGLPQTSDFPWRVEESEGSKRTVFEKHLVTKTSEERSESKETIVITKQITRVFESSETASSIQRLRDSVHSEKMRFFDEAEK